MQKLSTWMNNEQVGELTKQTNGAHTYKYDVSWLQSERWVLLCRRPKL